MRTVLLLGTILLASACSMQPPGAPKVAWQYGAGSGDGVSPSGPPPVYARAYSPGSGDGVMSGQTATESYSYGAENSSGGMVQMSPEQRQQLAAPAPTTAPTSSAAPAGAHI